MLLKTRTAIFPLWLATAALLFTGQSAAAETDISRFSDEAEAAKVWYAVNDTVMGGVSKGRVMLNAEGRLQFAGDLSLRNNGGFASIRSRETDNLLQGNNTINVRLRGDGRTYDLSLRDKNRAMAASHRYPIQTEKGKWIEVSVGLDQFNYTRFGRDVDRPELKPEEVIGVGFTLADKNPGPFKLEIDSITVSKTQAKPKQSDGTIVGVAQNAGNFKTLLAAAQAAGLAEALSDPDADLTVFAPTDDAFAKLPEGTVQTLLKRENRQQLTELLLNHVVKGQVTLTQQVETPVGEVLTIQSRGGATVGGANILQADIRATNGVVHIIDRVLLPKSMQSTPQGEAMRLISTAITQGVPAYNHGNVRKCADIYEDAVVKLTRDYRVAFDQTTARTLDLKLKIAQQSHHHDDNAWTLRAALDYAYDALSETMDDQPGRQAFNLQTNAR